MVIITQTPYKSIEVETNTGERQTISEGERIRFIVSDTGELRKGTIVGFKGSKPEKVEVEIIPESSKHKETWCVVEMEDGSLKLQEEDEEEEE